MKNSYQLILYIFVLILTGCYGKNIPLNGVVTFSDDNTPLTMGTVYLTSETFQASGHIQKDGSFIIGSEYPGNGIPPGTYKVSISGVYGKKGDVINSRNPNYSLIDAKWSSPQTSGMIITVDAKTRRLELKIDRNPK
ncbi:MAG: hypothetical protein LBC02_05455 [Planctomycetaceae bacterium]|jgi:hypothetical protein|nr:hypothetical protein [Planctomycetaceae bacterium]